MLTTGAKGISLGLAGPRPFRLVPIGQLGAWACWSVTAGEPRSFAPFSRLTTNVTAQFDS